MPNIEIALKKTCDCTIRYGYSGMSPKPDCWTCDGKGWHYTDLGDQLIEILKDLGLIPDE